MCWTVALVVKDNPESGKPNRPRSHACTHTPWLKHLLCTGYGSDFGWLFCWHFRMGGCVPLFPRVYTQGGAAEGKQTATKLAALPALQRGAGWHRCPQKEPSEWSETSRISVEVDKTKRSNLKPIKWTYAVVYNQLLLNMSEHECAGTLKRDRSGSKHWHVHSGHVWPHSHSGLRQQWL